MTLSRRLKISLLAAVSCLLAGSLVILLFLPDFLKITLIILFTAASVFVLSFILINILEGKSLRLRIPVFILVELIAICVVLCFTVYDTGLRNLFTPVFFEDEYDELEDMKDRVLMIDQDGLSGWRIPASSIPSDKSRSVILYFGDNDEDSSFRINSIIRSDDYSFLYERYDFVFIDYPSFGMSEGSLNESSLKEYALEAYDIVSSWDTSSKVIILADSFGTGPAVYLASDEDAVIEEIILIAPYFSGYDFSNGLLNIYKGPLRLLAPFKMPVFRFAEDVTCKVTVIASNDDKITAISSSRELFAHFTGSNCNFITADGVSHDDLFTDDAVLKAISDALEG